MAAAIITIDAQDEYSDELNKTRRRLNDITQQIAHNTQASLRSDAAAKASILTRNKELRAEKAVLSAEAQRLTLQRKIASQHRRTSTQIQGDLRATRRAIDSVNRSYRLLQGFIISRGIGLGIDFGRGIFDAALRFDTLRNTVISLTGSVTEANRRLEIFRDLARLPGISFEGAARAAIFFQTANIEISQSIRLLKALGNVAALSGQKVEDLSFNVSQLITQGTFNQRDYRELLNRAQIAAQLFGSSSADEVNKALDRSGLSIAEFIIQKLETAPTASADAASNVFNNFQIAIQQLSAEIGALALPKLTEQVRELTTYIQNNTETIVKRFEGVINLVVGAVDRLINNFRDFTRLLRSGALFFGLSKLSRLLSGVGERTADFAIRMHSIKPAVSQALLSLNTLLTAFSYLSFAATAVTGAFALIDFIRLVTGSRQVSSEVSKLATEVDKLTEGYKQLDSASTNANRSINLVGSGHDPVTAELTQRLQQLQAARVDIQNTFKDLRSRFRVAGAETLEDLRAEITRRRDLTSGTNNRNLLKIQESQLSEINTLIKTQAELESSVAEIRKRIANVTKTEELPAKKAVVEATKDQIAAENTLFSHRLRLLGLENRQRQIEREQASERDLLAQEEQQRLAETNRARIQEFQTQQVLQRNQTALAREQQRIQDRLNTQAFWRNVGDRIENAYDRGIRGAKEFFDFVREQGRDLEFRLGEGQFRNVQREQEVFNTPTQTPNLETIREDAAQQGRDFLRRIQKQEERDLRRSIEERERLYERYYQRIGDLAVDALFGRIRSVREFVLRLSEELLRGLIRTEIIERTSAARKIAIDNAVANAKIANIQRVSTAQQAAAAQVPAIPGIPQLGNLGGLGNLLSGGAGALGVASIIFPNELNNLFAEIGNTLSNISESEPVERTKETIIQFPDGVAKKVGQQIVRANFGIVNAE